MADTYVTVQLALQIAGTSLMQALRSDPSPAREQPPSGDSETGSRLDAFPSEHENVKLIPRERPPAVVDTTPPRRSRRLLALGILAILVTGGLMWVRPLLGGGDAGALRIETDVAGADVTVDGSYRGKTPLLLSLATGDHSVRVEQGSLSRTLPVAIAERTTIVHHISWPAAQATPVTTGSLEVSSEPRGQSITVDGQPRGVTPLTVTDLTPGEHEVVVRRDGTTVRRTVEVEAGNTASLMITGAATGVASGWLTVSVPVPLQVFEGDRLVGSSESDRILVPVGSHSYDLVNEALGFRVTRTVQVSGGQTVSLSIALPRGTINVNAVPWAQVWLDGQPLGETPIGNVSWTIGTHELLLRHPELGERRVTATITTGDPARVAVDMRKP